MLITLLTLLFASPWPAPSAEPVAHDSDVVVLSQRPVALTQVYKTSFRAEPESWQSAVLVLLRVETELARPRQAWTPVLFAGDHPAEILSRDTSQTCLVVLLPTAPEGQLLYWGDTTLPERVHDERGRAQLSAARTAGVAPAAAGQQLAHAAVSTRRLKELARLALDGCAGS